MWLYFVKRLFLFIPSLLILSMIVFALLQLSGGDPALNSLERAYNENPNALEEFKNIQAFRKENNLDLPFFYFSIQVSSSCDSLYKLPTKAAQKRAKALSYAVGDWSFIAAVDSEAKRLLQNQTINQKDAIQLGQILSSKSMDQMKRSAQLLSNEDQLVPLKTQIENLSKETPHLKNFIPYITFHGFDNQYHQWLIKLLKGDLGRSYMDNSSVSRKIDNALPITLSMSLSALLIALIIAVPLGVYAAYYENGMLDRICSQLFFAFYALPSFWVATLLVVFLGSGDFLKWFPIYGLGNPAEDATWLEKIQIHGAYLVLPIFCYLYGGLAYLFRHVRRSTLEELKQDYFLTAQSKGLGVHLSLWKHLFRKSSFPLITILGNSLPALISGSFIIEFIFSIDGMGLLMIDAFYSRDYPVILAVLLLGAALTLLGMWLADLFYSLLDPRIELHKSDKSLQLDA